MLSKSVIAPNGMIYMAGGEPEEKNFLYAFDSKGKLKWHNEFVAIGITELLVDKSSNLYASGMLGVTVFDSSKKVKWEKPGVSVFATDSQNHMVYSKEGYPSKLYGLSETGSTKWTFKTTIDMWSPPIYDFVNKNLLVADDEACTLYSYDGITGKVRWNVNSDAPLPVGTGNYRPSVRSVIEAGKSGITYYSAYRGEEPPRENQMDIEDKQSSYN
ncbi:PQQ-binding-like beta-propeller repeat protein [Priestia megaterium]|uniref:outer membrane protein assembly factor BamB family protein n=1 Tax=Priestia megaterium TaxID=1404 RepID=UPI003008B13E